LLDIGGVAVVDTAVANHLIKIAKAAVLMGSIGSAHARQW
jgi:anti-anti-sigma regulatory factor